MIGVYIEENGYNFKNSKEKTSTLLKILQVNNQLNNKIAL